MHDTTVQQINMLSYYLDLFTSFSPIYAHSYQIMMQIVPIIHFPLKVSTLGVCLIQKSGLFLAWCTLW